jgi:hypothetical protein
MLYFMPHEDDTTKYVNMPDHLRSLARLHPDYKLMELEESHAQLYRYFDLAWGVFVRLEQEGKLDDILTELRESPTVKAAKVEPT